MLSIDRIDDVIKAVDQRVNVFTVEWRDELLIEALQATGERWPSC